MIANLLISRRLDPAAPAAALTDAAGVPVGRVDVCHEDGGQDARDWEADVLCTYHYLRGDIAMSLDVYVRDEEGANCSSGEPGLAAALAEQIRAGVLYPDDLSIRRHTGRRTRGARWSGSGCSPPRTSRRCAWSTPSKRRPWPSPTLR